MATRNVYISKSTYPYFQELKIDFDWFAGFALSQKRKCEISLHLNFLAQYPNHNILEISSSSLTPLGVQLSAMNLSKETPNGISCVESIYQSSKIFINPQNNEKKGPFPEYLFSDGKTSKKSIRLLSSGLTLSSYFFENTSWEIFSSYPHLFYDYIYISALMEKENENVRNLLLDSDYDAFTDLATKSINCQARSAAIFVGLYKAGLINSINSSDSFKQLFLTSESSHKNNHTSIQIVPKSVERGDVIKYYTKFYGHLSNKKGALFT